MRPTTDPVRRSPEAGGASLDHRTQLVRRSLRRLLERREGDWVATAYPTAAEAVMCLAPLNVVTHDGPPDVDPSEGKRSEWADLEQDERERRNWERATGRAFSESRRYFVANRLRFMWVFTIAGDGLHGPEGRAVMMSLVAAFVRRFHAEFGVMPYWYSPELHPSGHGWHVNFFVPKRLPHHRMAELWGHGHVWVSDKLNHPDVKRKALPFVQALRLAALYACKYASKDWSPDQIPPGCHRFEAAQGFKPQKDSVRAVTEAEAFAFIIEVFGRPPDAVWRSSDCEDWEGPPTMCLRWSTPAGGRGDG